MERLALAAEVSPEVGLKVLDASGNTIYETDTEQSPLGDGTTFEPSDPAQIAGAKIRVDDEVVGSVSMWVYGSDTLMNKLDQQFRDNSYVALAFAGITKAAQMPFQTWLLGAMVAPTPTSALLHSSTMVKAGVFLLVKCAPLYAVCPAPSVMVMLVGGITFALCSFMAISQSNAKRVLAYSTIANLGLITMCAGVGTPEAVWAAIFLIIFHAIAKSLLFLCVGTAEHHIGSRDIEDMDLLFERMPRLARFMMLGIMCMFIAPFGMLVAKWATLVSFVDMDQVALILILAFGSAATFMFWAKWLGKLAGIAGQPENVELTVHKSEWASLLLMVVLLLSLIHI